MPPTGVLATLVSPEGRREETLAALQRLQAASAHEPGTTLFVINEHRDALGTFSVFERYEDDSAVDAHRGSPSMQEFRDALINLGMRPDLVFMDPIDPLPKG
jgi:quinol monooxygenase YgiN